MNHTAVILAPLCYIAPSRIKMRIFDLVNASFVGLYTARFLLVQYLRKIMPYYDNFWHKDAYENNLPV